MNFALSYNLRQNCWNTWAIEALVTILPLFNVEKGVGVFQCVLVRIAATFEFKHTHTHTNTILNVGGQPSVQYRHAWAHICILMVKYESQN